MNARTNISWIHPFAGDEHDSRVYIFSDLYPLRNQPIVWPEMTGEAFRKPSALDTGIFTMERL
jgi:hypothetical protein